MAAEKADLDHITTRSYSDQSSRNDADDDFAVPEKQNYARKSRTRSRITSCIAVVTIFVFGMAFQSTLAKTYTNLAYDTDFAPAREAIRMEKVEFIGALKFGEQGTVSFTNESRYFGATNTLAMETAWDDMLLNRHFLITDKEARRAFGPQYEQYYKYTSLEDPTIEGYVIELDVLHTLHCLKTVRDTVYNSSYQSADAIEKIHINHCLDIIRQTIECKGDLTPIPTKWWESAQINYIVTNQVHTCRSIAAIRDWTTRRYAHSHRIGVLQPRPTNLPPLEPARKSKGS